MALSDDGRYLYVVDQGGFQVHVIDVSKIQTGLDAQGRVIEPDNFAAVVGRVRSGVIRSGSRCRRTIAGCSSRTSACSVHAPATGEPDR